MNTKLYTVLEVNVENIISALPDTEEFNKELFLIENNIKDMLMLNINNINYDNIKFYYSLEKEE